MSAQRPTYKFLWKLMVSQRGTLNRNSETSGCPKHEAGFLLPSVEECIKRKERQAVLQSKTLSSLLIILNIYIHTQNAQRHENSSEGPRNLRSTTSNKAFAGSQTAESSKGKAGSHDIPVAQADEYSFHGAALPCCGNAEKCMRRRCSELVISQK